MEYTHSSLPHNWLQIGEGWDLCNLNANLRSRTIYEIYGLEIKEVNIKITSLHYMSFSILAMCYAINYNHLINVFF